MISQKQLKSLFYYSPTTGQFIRLLSKNGLGIGRLSGAVHKSGCNTYLRISIDGKLYYAHRLAWLYMYGSLPIEQIDHKDHNGLNNRILNLRAVSNSDNCKNMKHRANNTGVMGVYWSARDNQYQMWITVNYKRKYLGSTKSLDKAARIRRAAERRFGFYRNHGINC